MKKKDIEKWLIFHGTIVVVFGLGIKVTQLTELMDGFWTMGIGVILIICARVMSEIK